MTVSDICDFDVPNQFDCCFIQCKTSVAYSLQSALVSLENYSEKKPLLLALWTTPGREPSKTVKTLKKRVRSLGGTVTHLAHASPIIDYFEDEVFPRLICPTASTLRTILSAPSAVGVIASIDDECGGWPAIVRCQVNRKEVVSELEEMIVQRLRVWRKVNTKRYWKKSHPPPTGLTPRYSPILTRKASFGRRFLEYWIP